MSDPIEPFVQCELLFVKDGKEMPVTVGLGLSEEQYPVTCTIVMDGFHEPIKVGGVDRWQALCIGMGRLRMEMELLEMAGWKFEFGYGTDEPAEDYNDEDHSFSVDEFFSGLKGPFNKRR